MMQPDQCNHTLTGGRRMGRDRREYSYAFCIPERRSGRDRRQPDRILSMQVPVDPKAAAHGKRS